MPELSLSFPSNRAAAFAECDAKFAERICAVREGKGRPILVGLCGAQGSGKSTTAARLAAQLMEIGCRTAVLSLDDFYLTHAERAHLARQIHPLLITRGVPGTHDVSLARSTFDRLLGAVEGTVVVLPSFDKTTDDRAPQSEWRQYEGPCDVVLLEGWCVGARAQDETALVEPVNDLERKEDAEGTWRGYVNTQLSSIYCNLFGRLDLRLFLRAPDFDIVLAWRSEQETKLKRLSGSPMDRHTLARFIAHYERLTRWMLQDEPADVIIDLDADRVPQRWRAAQI